MAPRAVAEAARQAVAELKTMLSTDACVDDYLQVQMRLPPCCHPDVFLTRPQDQLILFMALAEGTSSLRCRELTMHTRTGTSLLGRCRLPVTSSPCGPARDLCLREVDLGQVPRYT